jgi:hypothetical protein
MGDRLGATAMATAPCRLRDPFCFSTALYTAFTLHVMAYAAICRCFPIVHLRHAGPRMQDCNRDRGAGSTGWYLVLSLTNLIFTIL